MIVAAALLFAGLAVGIVSIVLHVLFFIIFVAFLTFITTQPIVAHVNDSLVQVVVGNYTNITVG